MTLLLQWVDENRVSTEFDMCRIKKLLFGKEKLDKALLKNDLVPLVKSQKSLITDNIIYKIDLFA